MALSRINPGDFHAGEAQLENPASRETENALDQMSQDELKGLKSSLDNVSANQEELLQEKAEKRRKISTNVVVLSSSKVKVPASNLPDPGKTSQSLALKLPDVKTTDVQNVRVAASQSQTVRTPESTEKFEKEKGALVSGKIAQQSTDIVKSIADVNGLKSAVAKRIL